MRGLLILLFIVIAGWGFHARAQVGSDTAYVNFLMRQSDTLRMNKKFELAQEKLREAIRVFDERKMDKPATRTYLIRQIGGLYLDQGNYDAALQSFEEALDYARAQFPETDRNIIRTYLDLGIAWYYLGNFDRALLNYEYAENLILKSYDENKDLLANCYNNIGICSYFKHNYKKALNYYKKALEIAEAKETGKPSTRIASMYNNIGICYKYLQDYNQAINYYNKALAIKRLHRPAGHPDLVPNFNNLGTCYLSLNQNEKALGYFLKSEKILLESLGNDNPKLAPVFTNLGNTYIELGEYLKGREYLREAIKLHRKVYKNEFHPETGRLYINLGNSYFEQRRYDEALTEYRAAYEYFLPKEHEYPTLLAEAYYKAGQVYARKKEYDTALEFMDKALGKLHYSDTDFEHLERNISPMDLLTALSLKARTLVEYYTYKNDPRRLNEAETIFKQAIRILKYLKASFREAGSKQILLDKSFSTYEGAIAVCHQLYQLSEDPRYLEQAFEYAEQSNSILLQEAVQKTNAERFANLPDSLLDKEHNLKVDIAFFESKRFNEEQKREAADPQAINSYNSKIFDLKKQYFALLKTFETQYPEYYALRYASNSVSVETIQKELLKPNEALVEYFVGDDHIFAFAITPDTFVLEYIPKILPVEAWVEEFRNSIVQYNPLREDIHFL
ncbi:MAG: tetratricopeptide repeat protein, partial [Bacteroidetes bacterium]